MKAFRLSLRDITRLLFYFDAATERDVFRAFAECWAQEING